jgi:hypothetical protein
MIAYFVVPGEGLEPSHSSEYTILSRPPERTVRYGRVRACLHAEVIVVVPWVGIEPTIP